MRKIISKAAVTIGIILLMTASVNAQLKRPRITLGANFIYAMPQGDFKTGYKYGLGGEVFGGVGFGSTFFIATVGVTGYKAQSSGFGGTLTAVPVKVGVKQYFLLKKLFLNADAGIASLKANGVSSGVFTVDFGGGVRLLGLELGLYYNAFKNKDVSGFSNSINAKVGWSFTL